MYLPSGPGEFSEPSASDANELLTLGNGRGDSSTALCAGAAASGEATVLLAAAAREASREVLLRVAIDGARGASSVRVLGERLSDEETEVPRIVRLR